MRRRKNEVLPPPKELTHIQVSQMNKCNTGPSLMHPKCVYLQDCARVSVTK